MFSKIYDSIEEIVPVVLFLVIFVLMSVQIFTRYLFNFTLPWNIELSRYAFVWLSFIGAAYVRKKHAHIKIEILFNYLNKKLPMAFQKALWLFKEILTLLYLVALIYFGIILAYKSRRFMSQAMQISQFFLYISASVGSALYLLREIQLSCQEYTENFARTLNGKTKEYSICDDK